MTTLARMQIVIDQRRARPRYFDIGVKFDDLIEFKLWQAEADRLGIRLEKEHIDLMFNMEFFGPRNMQLILPPQDISSAQMTARRDIHRDATDAYIHRAIGEEFRVRIAEYVLLKAQPNSTMPAFRNPKDPTSAFKFSDSAVPDETRAPLTIAQLYDLFKSKRSEFEVTLLPIKVEDFIASLKVEPTEGDKREYFDAHKTKPYDPSADDSGIEILPSARIEFVYADPKSPFYLGKAKLLSALKTTNSIVFDAGLSPLGALARYVAIDHKHKADLQALYDTMVSKNKVGPYDRYRGAALYSDPDPASPIYAFMASQHDDLVASLIAASALAPIDGLSSFLAQGEARHRDEVQEALREEADAAAPTLCCTLRVLHGIAEPD